MNPVRERSRLADSAAARSSASEQATEDGRGREPSTHRRDERAAVRLLGPRPEPDDTSALAWQRATDAIERYRTQYQLAPDELGLGAKPPAGEFQQRLDHRQATEEVLDALQKQGHPLERDSTIEQRLQRALGGHEPDRGNGWEP